MRNQILFTGLLVFSMLTSFAPARAADDGPCKKDIETFCQKVPKGKALVECLTGHAQELSPSCKEKYMDMKARNRHASPACHQDVEKFCSNLKPGGGALTKCLYDHKAELSKGCQESFERRKR